MNDREQHVDEAIADYLAACDRGETPIRDAFLAKYPDLAESLGAFIDDHQRMKQAAPSAANDMTVTVGGSDSPKPISVPVTVPYFGDYELLSEIARGGMGVVYRARQVSLNRIVALKMILAGQLASPADVQRFRQEAEAAASLDHPHILPIHEVGEYQGQQYFSMKLVEGGSLSDRVSALIAQPKQGVALVQQIAAAVHYAHQRGILHRDLKPANILLDPDGTPYITDFGLAKKTGVEDSGLTRTGAIVGTPSYMAPEQARGEKGLTTAADIYAVGAILYELLTGRAPFKGESIAQTLRMVEEQEAPSPTSLNPQCDPDLAAIALKCLEKQATARYETAGALATDLARWQRGEPVTARRATTLRRALKWVRRNPVVAGLSVGLLLVMLVGTITSVMYAAKAKNSERQAQANEVQATNNATKATASAQEAKKLWYRGLFEQAKSLRMAHQPGWRAQALSHLKTAAEAQAEMAAINTSDEPLPTLLDLRSEAIMALIQRDAELTRTVKINPNVPVYFSGDGHRVFTVDYITNAPKIMLNVTDLATGQDVNWVTTTATAKDDFTQLLTGIRSLNHDGSEAVMTAMNMESIQIRNTRTGVIRTTLTDGTKGPINRLDAARWVMSGNGQWVAGVRRYQQHAEMIVWNVAKPKEPVVVARIPYPKEDKFGGELIRSGRYFGHLRISPDSKTLSFASDDRKAYRLFDLTQSPPKFIGELNANGELLNAIWHPTLPLIATVARVGSSQQVALWNVTVQKPQAFVDGDIEVTTEGKLNMMAFSHDGRFLAVPAAQPTTVRILNSFDGSEHLRINDVSSFRIGHLAWLANGELATYGLMEQMKCWRLPDDQPQSVYPNLRPQRRPAFSADGRWLTTYAPSGRVLPTADVNFVAYNMQSALMLDRIVVIDRQRRGIANTLTGFDVPRVGELLFSPDSQQLVAFAPDHILIREALTGKEVLRRALPKDGTTWSGTFYMADKRLVGMYEYVRKDMQRGIGLWDVHADQPLTELTQALGSTRFMQSLLVNPEGEQAFLPSPPTFAAVKGAPPPKPTSRLFELPSGRKLHELTLESPYTQDYTATRLLGPKGERALSLTTDLTSMKGGMSNENFQWVVHELPSGKDLFRVPVRAFAENACSFMNGHQWLVLNGDAGYAEVWDIARKHVLFRWQPHGGKRIEHLAADRGDIVTNCLNDDRLCILHLEELRPKLQAIGLDW